MRVPAGGIPSRLLRPKKAVNAENRIVSSNMIGKKAGTMYPHASDLTSPEVQQYSDREVFWIVKNGIRLSGMPAFGRVESDEHIWNLAHYVRTLGGSARPDSGGTAH